MNPLNELEKAVVLYLSLEKTDEQLALHLLQKLDPEKRNRLLDALAHKKVYQEGNVQSVLQEVHLLLNSKAAVFPKQSSIQKIENLMNEAQFSSPTASLSLDEAEMKVLETLLEQEGDYLGAMLFYCLEKQALVKLFEKLPEKKLAAIVQSYTQLVPKSQDIIQRFKAYFEKEIEKKMRQPQSADVKVLSRVLELLPSEKQDQITQSLLGHQALDALGSHLFKAEDLLKYSKESLRKIFENFDQVEDLAHLFELLPAECVEEVKSVLSERYLAMIAEEQSFLQNQSDPLKQKQAFQKMIVSLRQLEDMGEIKLKD